MASYDAQIRIGVTGTSKVAELEKRIRNLDKSLSKQNEYTVVVNGENRVKQLGVSLRQTAEVCAKRSAVS